MLLDKDIQMDAWCICPTTALADAQNYYTKRQVDQLIVEASGMTSGIVQSMIDESISGKADADSVYTQEEINDLLAAKADADEVPTKVSELDNDLQFATITIENSTLIINTITN